jgi:transcription initiation factor TFIIIB Brf1 subunit/transcription initiation factor TFIIB
LTKEIVNNKILEIFLHACIYYSFDIENNKQSYKNFCKLYISNVRLFGKYFALIKLNLNMKQSLSRDVMIKYIYDFENKNNVSKKTMVLAKKFIKVATEKNLSNGVSPVSLLAGAIVIAGQLNPKELIVVKHVALYFNISDNTIRNIIKNIYLKLIDEVLVDE